MQTDAEQFPVQAAAEYDAGLSQEPVGPMGLEPVRRMNKYANTSLPGWRMYADLQHLQVVTVWIPEDRNADCELGSIVRYQGDSHPMRATISRAKAARYLRQALKRKSLIKQER